MRGPLPEAVLRLEGRERRGRDDEALGHGDTRRHACLAQPRHFRANQRRLAESGLLERHDVGTAAVLVRRRCHRRDFGRQTPKARIQSGVRVAGEQVEVLHHHEDSHLRLADLADQALEGERRPAGKALVDLGEQLERCVVAGENLPEPIVHEPGARQVGLNRPRARPCLERLPRRPQPLAHAQW
jgi:hypothetical protein